MIHFEKGTVAWRLVEVISVCGEYPYRSLCILGIREAAAYSSIGINTIERLLRTPGCPFVLYVGKKRLVKRIPFEKYLMEHSAL